MNQSNYIGTYRSSSYSINKSKIVEPFDHKNNSQNFNENDIPQDAN